VADTPARLLTLLSLLQTPREWPGSELARRLGVSLRTVRRDVDRLRDLGYPVEASMGALGGYRLVAGTAMPPLLLDDDEAVAIAVGLRTAAGQAVAGIDEAAVRALAKLEQVLPHRLQRQVVALREATSRGPDTNPHTADSPDVDPGLLAGIAAAVRDHEEIRFDYSDERLVVEPYRLVAWERRWWLVGRDPRTSSWATYRVDLINLRTPGGRRFVPHPLPGGDYTAFVLREVAFRGWKVHARITVFAPAADVLARINPAVGVVETIDDQTCVLVTGADTVESIAVYIGLLDLNFRVTAPAALVARVATLAGRYARAVS
jgi:predicted DNA-binding transcriptional regulator YafY